MLLQKANQQYDEGRQNKDKASYRRALSTFDEALPKLEQAKDLEWVSFCRFRLGHCRELLNEYYEAVVAYDIAMDEWNACGRPKADANYPVVGAASIVAKVHRDAAIHDLGPVGSGYPSDPVTRAWLTGFLEREEPFPSCVRTRWGTIESLKQARLFGP